MPEETVKFARINMYSTLPAMTVTSLNRNATDGTFTNLTSVSDK